MAAAQGWQSKGKKGANNPLVSVGHSQLFSAAKDWRIYLFLKNGLKYLDSALWFYLKLKLHITHSLRLPGFIYPNFIFILFYIAR